MQLEDQKETPYCIGGGVGRGSTQVDATDGVEIYSSPDMNDEENISCDSDCGKIYSSPDMNDDENISCDSEFASPLCGWNREGGIRPVTDDEDNEVFEPNGMRLGDSPTDSDASYELVRVRKDKEPEQTGPSITARGHLRDGMNQKRFTETQSSPGSFSDVSRETKHRRVRPEPSGNMKRGPLTTMDGNSQIERAPRVRRGMPAAINQVSCGQVANNQYGRGT